MTTYSFTGQAHRTEGFSIPQPFTRDAEGETLTQAADTLRADMLAEGYYVRSINEVTPEE